MTFGVNYGQKVNKMTSFLDEFNE